MNRRHTSLPSYILSSSSDEKILNRNFHPAVDSREDPLIMPERILDARDKVQDCNLYQRESNSRSGRTGVCHEEKVINQENLNANARLNDHRVNIGGRRPGRKGRLSLDMDSSTGKKNHLHLIILPNRECRDF